MGRNVVELRRVDGEIEKKGRDAIVDEFEGAVAGREWRGFGQLFRRRIEEVLAEDYARRGSVLQRSSGEAGNVGPSGAKNRGHDVDVGCGSLNRRRRYRNSGDEQRHSGYFDVKRAPMLKAIVIPEFLAVVRSKDNDPTPGRLWS